MLQLHTKEHKLFIKFLVKIQDFEFPSLILREENKSSETIISFKKVE